MRIRAAALFCGLILFASAFVAGAVEPRPANVVHSFYAWYFSPSVRGRVFDHLPSARPYMTRSFWALLARVRPYEQTHGAVLDADPFIDAQIEASSVSLGSSFTQNGAATVAATVHYPKDPSVGRITVLLVRTDAGWRIDDIVGATGGSVRKALAHNMK